MNTDIYVNVLSDTALLRIRTALTEGPIFGFHMYCGGGRSGSTFVFSDFDSFLRYVSWARVGDIFLVWSTTGLEKSNKYLEKLQNDRSKSAERKTAMLEAASAYLQQEFREVVVVFGPDKDHLEALIIDLDGLDDLKRISNYAEHGGFVGVYPFTDIDRDECYLLKAKRPDARGDVPSGGAY